MKTVSVWHVQYAFRAVPEHAWQPLVVATRDRDLANAHEKRLLAFPQNYACVKVTGPHLQDIPDQ